MHRGKLRELLTLAEEQGCEVVKTRGQHWRIRLPDGRSQIYTSSTPGDWRGARNLASELKRKGIRRI